MLNFLKMTEKIHRSSYFPELDGLRGFAVLLVLFFHLNESGWLQGGFIGVDIFFVISGFIITKILYLNIESDNFSYRRFIEARIARLYPALLCVLIISMLVGFFLYTPDYYYNSAKSGFSALLSYSNWYFASGVGYWDLEQITDPFLHTWSLGIEQQFYLLWPLFLFLFLKNFSSNLGISIGLIFLVILSLLLSYIIGNYKDNGVLAFFSTLSRIFEFTIGGLLLIWQQRFSALNAKIMKGKTSELVVITTLAFLLFSAMYFDRQDIGYPNWITLCIVIATALCINAVAHARYSGWLLRNPIFLGIGILSYSLYLVHWPLIVFIRYLYPQDMTLGMNVIIVMMTFFLSIVLYVLVENRYRRLKCFVVNSTAIALCYSIVIMMMVSFQYIIHTQGIVYRDKFKMAQEVVDLLRGYNEIGVQSGYSIIGAVNVEPVIIVVGDSYAMQYMHSLDALLKQKKLICSFFESPCM